jgi:hypothetical protein
MHNRRSSTVFLSQNCKATTYHFSMTNTPPSAKAIRPVKLHPVMRNRETRLWRFLAPRTANKAASPDLPSIPRNVLPTSWDGLSQTQETTVYPCTPPTRTSIPLTYLQLPSLDSYDDKGRTFSPEVAMVIFDRHIGRGAPPLPLLDDDTPPPRAVTPIFSSGYVEEESPDRHA